MICVLFSFLEKEGTTNKPRRARHWFIRRCGRCLSRADSFRSSISSIPQYMVEAPTQTYNSIQNVTTDANSNESHAHSSVVDLSCSEGHVESDSVSLKELRTNCENYASTSSIKSTCVSVQGYMSPYEEAKSYTHQVVVVAPITGKISILCDYKRYIMAPVPRAYFWDHLCFICPSQPLASLAGMTWGQ